MSKRRRSQHLDRSVESGNHYWMSYSDLMSALLLIFALLLMVNVIGNQSKMEAKNQMIEEVLGVKTKLVKELRATFEDSNLEMEIDPQTGAIRFSSGVFFDHDKSKVSKKGKENLEQFVPKYLKVLLSDEFRDQISQIIIEGHTDDEGSYLYNLKLSQDRAFSVTEEIFSDDFPDFKEKDALRQLVTSNGRSFMVPIKNEDGSINAEKSRRVEFKFRLKDEETIDKIQDVVRDE